MTDHTPEPWTYRKMSEFCQVRIFCGARLMTTIRYGSSREAQGAVDLASRIVACVNACANIPAKQLGDMAAVLAALQDVYRLWELDALKNEDGQTPDFAFVEAALAPFRER